MGSFNNITTIHPPNEKELKSNFSWYMAHDKPIYINLSK
jgi:hypothetical protein